MGTAVGGSRRNKLKTSLGGETLPWLHVQIKPKCGVWDRDGKDLGPSLHLELQKPDSAIVSKPDPD